MARNTQVAADCNAPPITTILANFAAAHPSCGWGYTANHEAHRTFMNWRGCAGVTAVVCLASLVCT